MQPPKGSVCVLRKLQEGYIATANRSRVSIRGRPCKHLPQSSLITVKNLVFFSLSHTVCPHAQWRRQDFVSGGTGLAL